MDSLDTRRRTRKWHVKKVGWSLLVCLLQILLVNLPTICTADNSNATVTNTTSTSTSTRIHSGSQIGQPCTLNADCILPRTMCIVNKCSCESNLIYDKIIHKCVKRAGDKCDSSQVIAGTGTQQEILSCASNAHCDSTTNICTCNEPKYSVHTGKCYLNHGEKCFDNETEIEEDCHPLKHLHCKRDRARCACRQLDQVYDDNADTCIAKPGAECDISIYDRDELNIRSLRCVPNSICVQSPNYDNQDHKEEYQIARCRCKPGYANMKDEYCMPMYGMECDLDLDNSSRELTCAPNMNLNCEPGDLDLDDPAADLKMVNIGKCTCTPGSVLVSSRAEFQEADQQSETDDDDDDGDDNNARGYEIELGGGDGSNNATGAEGEEQKYEFESNVAAAPAKATASFDSICVRVLLHDEFCRSQDICTKNAACAEIGFPSIYNGRRIATSTCQCLPGFTPTPDGQCKAGYMSRCRRDDDCNVHLGLECVDRTCQCSGRTSTGFNGTHCVILEGGVCFGVQSEPESELESITLDCTINAFCSTETNYNRCRCLDTHSIESTMNDGKCYPALLHTKCDMLTNPCLPSFGLICINGVCSTTISEDKTDEFPEPSPSATVMETEEFGLVQEGIHKTAGHGHKTNCGGFSFYACGLHWIFMISMINSVYFFY